MPIQAKNILILIFLFFSRILLVTAQDIGANEEYSPTDIHTQKEFEAGKFVIEHVLDAYDWHIASIGDKHFSIPLPIILYSMKPELHGGKKLHVFMSSKFHHGYDDYRGFRDRKSVV